MTHGHLPTQATRYGPETSRVTEFQEAKQGGGGGQRIKRGSVSCCGSIFRAPGFCGEWKKKVMGTYSDLTLQALRGGAGTHGMVGVGGVAGDTKQAYRPVPGLSGQYKQTPYFCISPHPASPCHPHPRKATCPPPQQSPPGFLMSQNSQGPEEWGGRSPLRKEDSHPKYTNSYLTGQKSWPSAARFSKH